MKIGYESYVFLVLWAVIVLVNGDCSSAPKLYIQSLALTSASNVSAYDGAAVAIIAGGTPPYIYKYSNPYNFLVYQLAVTGLSQGGPYYFDVHDSCGQYASISFNVGLLNSSLDAPGPTPIPAPASCAKKPYLLPIVGSIAGDNACAKTQVQILQDLYNNLGGKHWKNNARWLSGNPCTNNWYGITCNQNGDVVNIDLHNNNLTGTQLPPSVGCLPYLKGLILENNNISGQLPNNLCKLVSLMFLTISNNNIGGSIPSCFSELVNIQTLFLNGNGLSGFMPDLSQYSTLRDLDVSNNCLSGAVPLVINSSVLVALTFDNNYFSGCIPDVPYNFFGTFNGNLYCSASFSCQLPTTALNCTVPINHERVTTCVSTAGCAQFCATTIKPCNPGHCDDGRGGPWYGRFC